MPQYKKVFDIGTYTGNGGQYRVGIPTLRVPGPSGKQVAGSLRFRNVSSNDAKLSRTFSAGNQLKWTWSTWIKMGPVPNSTMLFNYNSGNGYARSYHELTTNCIDLGDYSAGGSYIWHVQTTQIFKDPATWYHLVVIYDSAQATASNRVKIYVNGQQITSFSTASYPSQNYSGFVNQSGSHVIGSIGYQTGYSFDGYMSEMYFLDGYAYDSSYFGEYNSDGIWVPKAYSGSYGTNGFYLPMNSSSNYATDQSGNGNNWTPNNMNVVTANTTYDLLTDSPTDYASGTNNIGNYAILNSADNTGSMTLAYGNLGFYKTSTYASIPATIKVTSGKWYFECGYVSDAAGGYGIGAAPAASFPYSSYIGASVGCSIWKGTSGTTLYLNGGTNTSRSITAGDTMVCALDCDNGKIWVGYYSVSAATTYWLDSSAGITGNPSTGANPSGTFTAGTLMAPGASYFSSGVYQFINFGQRAFTLTPPTGFNALNTYNYPRPADSSLWFNGDSPDLMWIKNRSTTGLHTITDTVRGMGLNLVSSSTNAETSYPAVTEMNKFGMTVINDATSIVNGSTNSHVYWGWKAGGTNIVTNTSGSVSSQVSANPAAGFSIVTYSGASGAQTVGHGLGAAPAFIIVKARHGGAGYNWAVYHNDLTSAAYFLRLNTTDAQISSSSVWGTAPTSTVFSIGTDAVVNDGTTGRHVAYCWTPIAGYSAFGKYTGNGAADGPFVYTGFRPRWLLVKRTDSANDWLMWDSTRDTYNLMQNIIYANATTAETTYVNDKIDFLSNGFKQRQVGTAMNGSGATYIYAAFAENPFKYARSR